MFKHNENTTYKKHDESMVWGKFTALNTHIKWQGEN